ncbi:hypothetical protein Thimo_2745 [Thioflavicoccus mobilis 8321]|uniref:Glycine-zipper-containing OmpA-like membrane domain-containing protein n=1 Tax=Thioflavicoccus mobilis 8321 TaxID=765912 RepID=L0H1E2_9GAMM|nr:hypothetical protein [Thioflavicoccus mobilis]AGA91455.1 hypothetical protein Thimo_2745 [Thioflavicoccus mobilis 8321]
MTVITQRWLSVLGVTFFVALSVVGCASSAKRPILYPNDHYGAVGAGVAQQDIDDCMRQARAFGADAGRGEAIAGGTLAGALIGGATAGAWGAVRGDAAERALAGAAAGGAGGLTRGALRSREPSSTFRNFVQRCLSERGYDVIGWR